MKFSKLICAMILILSLFCSLTACGNSDKKPIEQEKSDLNVNSSSSIAENSTSATSADRTDVDYEENEDKPSLLKRVLDGIYDFADIDYIRRTDRTFGKIVESIENQDSAELKSLFSKNAIKEAKTLDKDIEELFGFVKGNIISFSNAEEGMGATQMSRDYGKEETITSHHFTIETDEAKYYLGLRQCVEDDFDSDNEGVTYFCIINAEDWKDEHIYMDRYENAFGIIID